MLAIIAGTGNLPIEAAKIAQLNKKNFFIVSLFPEDNFVELANSAGKHKTHTLDLFKLGAVLDFLKEKNATEILFIGKVDKRNLLNKVSLDWLAIKLLAQIVGKSDAAIMEHLVSFAQSNGLKVIQQNEILQSLIVSPGVLTGKFNSYIESNIKIGLEYAKKLSELDIGQTVILKDEMILAVEAIEGTDECIKRGIALGKNNVVICKAAKIDQNKKYDLPTLGPNSLVNIHKGEVAAIAWQSEQTFIVDREEFVHKADELGITLISV